MTQKRFQYFTREGKQWSNWFDYDGPQYKYQFANKLRNEYRETDEED